MSHVTLSSLVGYQQKFNIDANSNTRDGTVRGFWFDADDRKDGAALGAVPLAVVGLGASVGAWDLLLLKTFSRTGGSDSDGGIAGAGVVVPEVLPSVVT
jgi:hypothetical protein